jgi:hypothetical protein
VAGAPSIALVFAVAFALAFALAGQVLPGQAKQSYRQNFEIVFE